LFPTTSFVIHKIVKNDESKEVHHSNFGEYLTRVLLEPSNLINIFVSFDFGVYQLQDT